MINTKVRLIMSFSAENEEALYSQQKQNLDLTVALIINSLWSFDGPEPGGLELAIRK